jgi:hypothetical protein
MISEIQPSAQNGWAQPTTIQRLNTMVKYSTRDQEKLGFAFIHPDLGHAIADKFGFKLLLIDHDDPQFAETVRSLYAENGWDTSQDRSTDNGGFIFRTVEQEDLIWVRTFKGNIAAAIFFHEIGHMLGYWLADRDEEVFCERLSVISSHFPKSFFSDAMESYAWMLGACMAVRIDLLCSKKEPVHFTRDYVMAVTLESGHEPRKRILFRYFAAYLQGVESKIRWHVARKSLMEAVKAADKSFMKEFVEAY